uniref:PLAC8 family protein n=1 Tax=Kalanchoe fedtschenkoi TaxID=63787 RepID=A0A7N0REJ4_KALFE
MAVLDFDMLCSTVALQTHGKWTELNVEDGGFDGVDSGGVLRMWEGEVLDCFEDRRVAVETACCPCYRFGKNMRQAGFGYCFLQGSVYFILTVGVLLSLLAFVISKRRCYLFITLAFAILSVSYASYFRTQVRKKFNIRGADSSLDDCAYHLACPCCALCQESRTLDLNNVRDGIWHGRGDTICVGGNSLGPQPFTLLQPPPIIATKS